jgi:DNA-binding XRE family transcriptional regulator
MEVVLMEKIIDNTVLDRKGNPLHRREWLKAIRKKKGYSVREIAPLIGCSWTHYSDIENGRRNPSLDLAIKIAKTYGFKVEKFISA